MHLDQTNFAVQNKAQLQLLTTILVEGLGSQPFPVKFLFRDWNYYKYGQVTELCICHACLRYVGFKNDFVLIFYQEFSFIMIEVVKQY